MIDRVSCACSNVTGVHCQRMPLQHPIFRSLCITHISKHRLALQRNETTRLRCAWVRKPPKSRHRDIILADLLLRASPRSDLCVWARPFEAKGNVSRTFRLSNGPP
jgi:hypothetical protein